MKTLPALDKGSEYVYRVPKETLVDLEVNTAPGIEESSLAAYVNAIRRLA